MGTTSDYMWEKMKQEFSLPLSVAEYIQQMTALRQAMIKRDGIRVIPHVQEFVIVTGCTHELKMIAVFYLMTSFA
jgi:hypothetical protein